MEILKNDEEAFIVFAMQGEANISNIKFKIKLNDLNIDDSFETQNLLTIIQFEDDYLTNIPDTNIKSEIKDNNLIINWIIGKAMTLEAKDRKFQVIVKNKETGEIFKSYTNIFRVQKSIESENENSNCDTTCIAGMLEQWNLKMQQIVDTGGNADLSEYAKTSEIAENYYNKIEIDENFQTKNDNNLITTNKNIVGAINEIKNSIPTEIDLSNYYEKAEVDTKLNEKQNKNDNTLETTDKTIVGAINEVNTLIKNSTGADLSNYYSKNETYNKSEIDNKLDIKLDKTIYDVDKNKFQLKEDNSLITTNKTIVGAINELSESSEETDLSNYYQKTEIDTKLGEKLNISTYNIDKPTFQLKEDNNLNTSNKTIVGAINEINTDKITLSNLSASNGINYNNTNGEISANIDNKTIKLNTNGALEAILEGGQGDNSFGINNTSPAIEGEALTINYFNKANTYWTGNNFPYTHNGNASATDVGYLVLKVDKTNLDSSCSVLKIKTTITNITSAVSNKNASSSIYVRSGGEFTPPSTFTNYIVQENAGRFSRVANGTLDLSDSNKDFYVFIPEIDKNDIFIDISASEDSIFTIENIEIIQMLNTKVNLEMHNNKYVVPFKVGINSSMYIGDGGIIERSNGSLNISYGIKTLKLVNSIGAKSVSRTLGIGHYTSEKLIEGTSNTFVGVENSQYLEKGNYNIIVGDNACPYTHISASSGSYDYITEMNQCTIIGSYAKPKINTSINENIIGYNAKGNGSNTFTLGNSNITALYAQVASITQFSDLRIKKDVKDINIDEIISNIKGLKVIHASYMDLEEFIGNSENDRHKLMFDGASYRNSFKNDTKLVDRIFHPIDPVTKKRKTNLIETLNEDGENISIEEEEILEINDCIEITHNQLLPALVATNQYLLNEVESLKNTIKGQTDLINRILSRLEVLENN